MMNLIRNGHQQSTETPATMKEDIHAKRKKIKGKEAKAKNPLNPKKLNNLSREALIDMQKLQMLKIMSAPESELKGF